MEFIQNKTAQKKTQDALQRKEDGRSFTPPASTIRPVPAQLKKNPLQKMQLKKDEEEKPKQLKKEEEEKPLQAKKDEDEPKQLKKDEEEKPKQLKKEEEKKLMQAKKEEEGKPGQLKKEGNPNSNSNTPTTDSSKKLPGDVQAKMEHSFGADFSGVNIHEGKKAAEVGARAYTQGNNIHFAPGEFNPSSQQGQELLGHELTHVLQQQHSNVQATTQFKGIEVNDSPALEKEADDMGRKAASGEKADTSKFNQ